VTAGAWRIIAPIVSMAALGMGYRIVKGNSVAAETNDRFAGAAVDARPVAADARSETPVAQSRPAKPAAEAPPAGRLSPAECGRLRRSVERELTAAQRCKADRECAAVNFEYAFRPCGESARAGASLDKAAADAKAYVDTCHPLLHPIKCAHRTIPVCARGRCALTSSPGE
jgi:hypothetical protein